MSDKTTQQLLIRRHLAMSLARLELLYPNAPLPATSQLRDIIHEARAFLDGPVHNDYYEAARVDPNDEYCPGCAARPGDGINQHCEHPLGCGFWRQVGDCEEYAKEPAAKDRPASEVIADELARYHRDDLAKAIGRKLALLLRSYQLGGFNAQATANKMTEVRDDIDRIINAEEKEYLTTLANKAAVEKGKKLVEKLRAIQNDDRRLTVERYLATNVLDCIENIPVDQLHASAESLLGSFKEHLDSFRKEVL